MGPHDTLTIPRRIWIKPGRGRLWFADTEHCRNVYDLLENYKQDVGLGHVDTMRLTLHLDKDSPSLRLSCPLDKLFKEEAAMKSSGRNPFVLKIVPSE